MCVCVTQACIQVWYVCMYVRKCVNVNMQHSKFNEQAGQT